MGPVAPARVVVRWRWKRDTCKQPTASRAPPLAQPIKCRSAKRAPMTGATLDELRELSLRSRRAQSWGFAAVAGAMTVVPLQLAARGVVGETWALLGSMLVAGALFVRWAYVVGEERGAFRKVFRRLRDERSAATRRVPVAEGPAGTLADAPAPSPVQQR